MQLPLRKQVGSSLRSSPAAGRCQCASVPRRGSRLAAQAAAVTERAAQDVAATEHSNGNGKHSAQNSNGVHANGSHKNGAQNGSGPTVINGQVCCDAVHKRLRLPFVQEASACFLLIPKPALLHAAPCCQPGSLASQAPRLLLSIEQCLQLATCLLNSLFLCADTAQHILRTLGRRSLY